MPLIRYTQERTLEFLDTRLVLLYWIIWIYYLFGFFNVFYTKLYRNGMQKGVSF